VPFPLRAWFVAAFGLPVGGILLFAFVVRAYLAIFHPDQMAAPAAGPSDPDGGSRFEHFLLRVSRYNVFIIGFLVLLGIFAYWVVPNVIGTVGRVGIETLTRYKWFFLAAAGIALGLVIWVIYLRYLLARKSIESRTELEKHRIELAYQHGETVPAQLAHANAPERITWEGEFIPEPPSPTDAGPSVDRSEKLQETSDFRDADRYHP
jgi:hypothetical protein